MTNFEIITSRPAPTPANRGCRSKWQNFFDGMHTGNWFIVSKSDKDRVYSAANSRIPGRFKLYKSNEFPGVHVFVMKAKQTG